MINKQKPLPLRYSTLSPSLSPDKRGKFKSLIQIKQKRGNFNTTLTKYKSIREIKRKQEVERNKTQKNLYQYERAKNQDKCNYESLLKNTDIIEIIKLKLHENDTSNQRVKTECTMNRSEFKNFIKKKKTFDFISNHSIDLIKNMFPKKIDLIINQLKIRRTEEKGHPHDEIVIDLKNRPKTAAPTQEFLRRSRNRSKMVETPGKWSIQAAKTTGGYEQVRDVSGWEIDPLEQELVFIESTNRPKSKLKTKK